MKKIIGLTGGAGAGKTSVLQILKEEYHAHAIIADEVGRKLMEPGQLCFQPILDGFGENILTEDGHLNRGMLSGIVFSKPDRLALLDEIVHPAVKQAILREIAETDCELVVIEAALLLEAGYREICDELWYLYAPAQVRVRRLYENRGYSEVKSYAIMKNQLSDTEFRRGCDFLLDNSHSLDDTRKQIQKKLGRPVN